MSNNRSRRLLRLVGVGLLVITVAAGCARRAGTVDMGSVHGPAATVVATPAPTPVPAPARTPFATDWPASTAAPTSQAVGQPVATPDLTAIQQLLDDLDAALGADATADTDEGSSR